MTRETAPPVPYDVRREGDALRTQLQSGKSLADVAKAQNKDVAGLKAAMDAYVKQSAI